jgi:guanylate kinase
MNKLVHLADFEEILSRYRVSDASKQILKDTPMVVLTGPSSSGRNTIIGEIRKQSEYYFIVSDTTRKPRSNNGVLEKNGEDYWFRSEEELLSDLKAGAFLEAEIIHSQQVSGISIRELKKASTAHKIAITDMDIGGIQNVVQAKPDVLPIIVLPPDFDEWQRRLDKRGSMDTHEHRRRLRTAVTIFKEALKHDYFIFVVNQNYKQTAALIDTMAKNGSKGLENREDGHKLVKELLTDTEAFLESN